MMVIMIDSETYTLVPIEDVRNGVNDKNMLLKKRAYQG